MGPQCASQASLGRAKLEIKWKVNSLGYRDWGNPSAVSKVCVSDRGRVRVPECPWVCSCERMVCVVM